MLLISDVKKVFKWFVGSTKGTAAEDVCLVHQQQDYEN